MEQNCTAGECRIMELERCLADLLPQFEDIVTALPESDQSVISAFLSVSADFNTQMMYEMYMLGKEQGRHEK